MDIYGRAAHLDGAYAGAQCKRKSRLTIPEIEEEAGAAKEFEPPLAEYVVATTASRDASLQRDVRLLSQRFLESGGFRIEIVFWEDICLDLSGDGDLVAKHFPNWAGLVERRPTIAVSWWGDAEEERDQVDITAAPPDLCDFETAFRPFSEDELTWLGEDYPDDAKKACEYNDAVVSALSDAGLKRSWLRHMATARWEKFGVSLGLAVSVEEAPAENIIVTLEFPSEVEVCVPDEPPESCPRPDLPRRPELTWERRLRNATMAGFMDRVFPQALQIAPVSLPVRRLYVPTRGRSRRVLGRRVTLHLDRLPQRRVQPFSGDSLGLVLVGLREGSFRVPWEADAENLAGPVSGELQVDVQPHPPEADEEGAQDRED